MRNCFLKITIMGYLRQILLAASIACCAHVLLQAIDEAHCLQQVFQANVAELQYPNYMQSPMVANPDIPIPNLTTTYAYERPQEVEQRSLPKPRLTSQQMKASRARLLNGTLGQATEISPQSPNETTNICLYDKSYFVKLDECLARKPYPTVGLPAFKNEDLLVKRGLSDKHGCVFVLNNGLFKSFHINKYAVESDSKCLDGNKVGLSMGLNNVTLSYLWTLRCLNRADQLLDDATLDGKTTLINEDSPSSNGICVGSSQSFGFTSLQLSSIEAQMELSTDIFKNWRVTNVTVAMSNPQQLSSARSASGETGDSGEGASLATNIKDYVFESLDGDELNWRYLHLFQNWSRNRMHTNFLDQYKRFLWISLQRCLSESSERLPTKVKEVFVNQKYT